MELQVQETRDVWVVYSNSDLTEGRGYQYPRWTCWAEATAIRYAKGNYVMGSDCPVQKSSAFRIGGKWFAPTDIQKATADDLKAQGRIDARTEAMAKAKAAGLTDDDLRNLGVQQ